MSLIGNLLRRFGILPMVSANEMLNAETENELVAHRKAADALITESVTRTQETAKLKRTLMEARIRATPFAQIEMSFRKGARSGNNVNS